MTTGPPVRKPGYCLARPIDFGIEMPIALFVEVFPHLVHLPAVGKWPLILAGSQNECGKDLDLGWGNQINPGAMSSLLYLIAVILVIGWLLGVFVYSLGSLIHILLVIAVIAVIFGVIRRV